MRPIPSLDIATEAEIDIYEPIKIGPTWQTKADGTWHLPELTLGWEIAGWCAQWLRGEDGLPWRFTSEQLRLVLWWYAVDGTGRFIHRKGVIQRLKGWGRQARTPLLPSSAWSSSSGRLGSLALRPASR